MTYALIKNGIVINTVVIADTDVITAVSKNAESAVRIDNLSPVPGVGDSYDGDAFTPATPVDSTGDITIASVGSSPNAGGASFSGQVLILQPANESYPGVVTTGSQAFVGAKTFNDEVDFNSQTYTTGLINVGFETISIGVKTSAGDYPMNTGDQAIVINKESGEATTITLPASPEYGRLALIKDGKGDSATNHITVIAADESTIDGAVSDIIQQAYGWRHYLFNGNEWNRIS